MNIVYREARGSDASALLEHVKKVGAETDNLSFDNNSFAISEERESKFIERFRNNKKDIMLIALDAERVVANAALECNRIPRYNHRAELSVTVLWEYWGKGIGSELLSRLIEFAREVGIKVISLEVRADNDRAIALYRKFGFSDIGVYRNFFIIKGKFHDAILMQLCL